LDQLPGGEPGGLPDPELCTAKATFTIASISLRNAISIVYTFHGREWMDCENRVAKKIHLGGEIYCCRM
jgi:hypothetical protein